MPTNKKRICLTLSDETSRVLSKLATRDGVTEATKAVRLIESALEYEEDQVWELSPSSEIQKVRDLCHTKKHGN